MSFLKALGSFVGFFIAFGWGYKATAKLLDVIANRRIAGRTVQHDFLTRKNIRFLTMFGGGIAVALYLLLLFIGPTECLLPILSGLLISGFYFITDRYLGEKSTTSSRTKTVPPPIYSSSDRRQTNSVETKLEELTKTLNWDWVSFRSVLITLAKIGEGHYITASRRPDIIGLYGLQTTFADLRKISVQSHGRETSRVVFVDRERSCLVISGKTHIGTTRRVKIDMEPQPGRERVQIPVLTIHVHPSKVSTEGLSDIDYISFLSDRRQIIMMICFQGGILFAMKTSATSQAISASSAQHMIATIRNDILKIWSNLYLPNSILAFNKAVCMEFGMTLYQTTGAGEIDAQRIEVTSF